MYLLLELADDSGIGYKPKSFVEHQHALNMQPTHGSVLAVTFIGVFLYAEMLVASSAI